MFHPSGIGGCIEVFIWYFQLEHLLLGNATEACFIRILYEVIVIGT